MMMSTNPAEGFARLSVAQVQAKLAAGWSPVWIDVRKPHEWAEGKLDEAHHFIPHEAVIAHGLPELDPDAPVLLQCRSGVRSAHAAMALVARDFTDVTNLEGGILAWLAATR
jgi:adenylyltransferase/sulfurtransferase